jgi:GR25 family glycosyltransferase involved in LPS biosynthesis
MKSYVITIDSIPESVKAAERCIRSMPEYNVQKFSAITPDNDPIAIAEQEGISLSSFKDGKYSRFERCVSAFLSHYSLWKMCIEDNEEYQVFEHDAVCVGTIPQMLNYKGCVSLGVPSYGKYNTPTALGVVPLTSKNYFPGAHAYRLNPKGASTMVSFAKENAAPTDVFLDKRNLPWLEEYYPWPVEARDNFSTIQHEGGCQAKHGYNEKYKLL